MFNRSKFILGTIAIIVLLTGCANTRKINNSPTPAVKSKSTQTTPQIPTKITQANLTPASIPINLPNISANNNITAQGTIPTGNKLMINNISVNTDAKGNYKQAITLQPGANQIDLKYYGNNGLLLAHETRTINYSPKLSLNILTPATVSSPQIKLSGITLPNSVVYINGEETLVDQDGSFMLYENLKPGKNKFNFIVEHNNMQYAQSKVITFSPPAPTIQCTAPQYNSGAAKTNQVIVQGITQPGNLLQVFLNESNASTKIKSQVYQATVDETGKFQSTVDLAQGINSITIVATNNYGLNTSKVLTVNGK